MSQIHFHSSFSARVSLLAVALLAVSTSGCEVLHRPENPLYQATVPSSIPREKCKAILPDYTIEPPDVLTIDAINLVPRSPYKLSTLDVIVVQVEGTLPDQPISGPMPIEPGGIVRLGPTYGAVKVTGMTIDDASVAIEKQLKKTLLDPKVTVSLGEIGGKQQIAGEHLVSPDGKVNLGSYGRVSVVGMTVEQATRAIEEHLSQHLEEPKISLDVFGYNSKVYYVITQGAGLGDGVARFPVTGNETVLDAITQINGLTQFSSKRIWIARPGHNADGCDQILPVDWTAVSQFGAVDTNYQLLPGDRVYVAEDKLVAFDTALGKLISPVERVFGVTLLGTNTVKAVKFVNTPPNNQAVGP